MSVSAGLRGEVAGARARRWLRYAGALVAVPAYPALALLVAVTLAVRPGLLTVPFALIVLRQAAPIGLAALGQSAVIRGRSLDLSIGGVTAVADVVLANRMISTQPWWAGAALVLLIGAVAGLANGVLVARVKASAVMVTLGSSLVLVGSSFLLSGGAPGGQVHATIKFLATGRLGTVPVAAVIWLAVAALAGLLFRFTVFGRVLAAVGSNFRAAALGGLPVARTLLVAHVLCGLTAAAAGLLLSGYIGTGTMNLGADLVLASIAACILGGTNFGGGRGGVLGCVAGAIVLTLLTTLLTSFGVPQPLKLILQGVIVASAAALARR